MSFRYELLEKNVLVKPIERNVTFVSSIDTEQLKKLSTSINAEVSWRFALNFICFVAKPNQVHKYFSIFVYYFCFIQLLLFVLAISPALSVSMKKQLLKLIDIATYRLLHVPK